MYKKKRFTKIFLLKNIHEMQKTSIKSIVRSLLFMATFGQIYTFSDIKLHLLKNFS